MNRTEIEHLLAENRRLREIARVVAGWPWVDAIDELMGLPEGMMEKTISKARDLMAIKAPDPTAADTDDWDARFSELVVGNAKVTGAVDKAARHVVAGVRRRLHPYTDEDALDMLHYRIVRAVEKAIKECYHDWGMEKGDDPDYREVALRG